MKARGLHPARQCSRTVTMLHSSPDPARREQEAVMTDAQLDEILAHIDAAVGPPEDETVEEHEQRREMIERDARARAIRRQR